MKKNILFISHLGGSGGSEKCLLDLVNLMDKNKFNIYVNVPYKGDLSAELQKEKISYFISTTEQWIPSESKWGIDHLINFFKTLKPRIWAIDTKIQKLNIDLVYSNSTTCIDGALAAYHINVPHIWHLHENIKGNHSIKSYLPVKLTYFVMSVFCKNFIAVSSTVSSFISKKKSFINIIPNGVNINNFIGHSPKKSLRKELNLSQDTKIIAQIGSLIPVKGISTFIRSAEDFLSRQLKHKPVFLLIGSGHKEFTQSLIETINYSPYKQFFYLLGQRDDISQILPEIDILIVASESEGFSRVIIEAMSAAKPIVSTRCGGPEDIIIDGETGFLVPLYDSHAISEKLLYLLDHPDFAITMGEKGYARVKQLYSMENYVSSIEKVILETLERHNEK